MILSREGEYIGDNATLGEATHQLFILSMLLLWVIGFLVIYPIVGFPDGILEQATQVLQSTAVK